MYHSKVTKLTGIVTTSITKKKKGNNNHITFETSQKAVLKIHNTDIHFIETFQLRNQTSLYIVSYKFKVDIS